MTEILAFLQIINQSALDTTTRKRMALVILAMLAMAGRITMRGISRWTEEGGSYRTVQKRRVSEVVPREAKTKIGGMSNCQSICNKCRYG
ncbi:hypothetical protein MNBD_CHLOROFLEXI01-4604 [hydrothermal vent metagenome]|uniref:Uncharacterized protein n=1 Tax=hydrothermal vent metagenome TaxID=652676 RepID=A0A3B0V088_9ZZZZ